MYLDCSVWSRLGSWLFSIGGVDLEERGNGWILDLELGEYFFRLDVGMRER